MEDFQIQIGSRSIVDRPEIDPEVLSVPSEGPGQKDFFLWIDLCISLIVASLGINYTIQGHDTQIAINRTQN